MLSGPPGHIYTKLKIRNMLYCKSCPTCMRLISPQFWSDLLLQLQFWSDLLLSLIRHNCQCINVIWKLCFSNWGRTYSVARHRLAPTKVWAWPQTQGQDLGPNASIGKRRYVHSNCLLNECMHVLFFVQEPPIHQRCQDHRVLRGMLGGQAYQAAWWADLPSPITSAINSGLPNAAAEGPTGCSMALSTCSHQVPCPSYQKSFESWYMCLLLSAEAELPPWPSLPSLPLLSLPLPSSPSWPSWPSLPWLPSSSVPCWGLDLELVGGVYNKLESTNLLRDPVRSDILSMLIQFALSLSLTLFPSPSSPLSFPLPPTRHRLAPKVWAWPQTQGQGLGPSP